MSCIYGTDQFGQEDQGWVAWFVSAALTGAPITIYPDGKQVRDVLFVGDLLRAYEALLASKTRIRVYDIGGGPSRTLSLLELLGLLGQHLGRPILPQWGPWRPSDQKVYVSDIRRAERESAWRPHVRPADGVAKLTRWVQEHQKLFAHAGCANHIVVSQGRGLCAGGA
jgi:CDP-paratose 2-epimerase